MIKRILLYLFISFAVVAPLYLLYSFIYKLEVMFPNFDPITSAVVVFCTCLISHKLNEMKKD